MYYIKGYEIKTVGVFSAKEWFEGLTDDVLITDADYVINGVSIPKDHITLFEETTANTATLTLGTRRKAKKSADLIEALKRFDHEVGLLDSGLRYSEIKHRETKMVPPVDFESLALDVKFARAVLSKADPTDRRLHQELIQRAKRLYDLEFKRILTTPKYSSIVGKK